MVRMKNDPKYLFVSTGRVFGEDGVGHLLHAVSGQALQHVLLVGSLKKETKYKKFRDRALGGDRDRLPLQKTIPPAFLSYEQL